MAVRGLACTAWAGGCGFRLIRVIMTTTLEDRTMGSANRKDMAFTTLSVSFEVRDRVDELRRKEGGAAEDVLRKLLKMKPRNVRIGRPKKAPAKKGAGKKRASRKKGGKR
jgi:hypothetical protein